MQAQHAALRASCTANNAYQPALALSCTLLPTPGCHNAPATSFAAAAHRASLHRNRTQSKSISSSPRRQAASQDAVSPSDEGKLHKANSGKKIGAGGTYAGYEAIREFLRPTKSVSDETKVATAHRAPSVRRAVQGASRRRKEVATPDPAMPSVDFRQATQPARQPARTEQSEGTVAAIATEASSVENKVIRYTKEFAPSRIHWRNEMLEIGQKANILAQTEVDLADTETIEERRKQLDYNPYPMRPDTSDRTTHRYPWVSVGDNSLEEDKQAMLEREIQAFVDFISPSQAEAAGRGAVVSEVTDMVASSFGTSIKCELQGSETTGLALATSDIDMRLLYNHANPKSTVRGFKRGLESAMFKLCGSMRKSREYTEVVFRNAKFPIINATHHHTGLMIQLVSAPSSAPQQEVTRRYLSQIPNLRSTYLVLRTAFGMRELVDVWPGGVGSYGLFIMLVASLTQRNLPPAETSTAQILQFLKFYSEFDYHKHGLTLSPKPKLFLKHDAHDTPTLEYSEAARRRNDPIRAAQWSIGQRRLYQGYLLCLQDPANPLNDLGRKSNAIKHVQKTAESMHLELLEVLGVAATRHRPGKVSDGSSLLARVVGRPHDAFRKTREKLTKFGRKALGLDGELQQHVAVRQEQALRDAAWREASGAQQQIAAVKVDGSADGDGGLISKHKVW